MSEVLVSVENGLGRLTLNRPAALHALTKNMCEIMTDALLKWREDPNVKTVLIDHLKDTRGFCAGGDIRTLSDSVPDGGGAARAFFYTEYRLNHLLFVYPKPVVAIMDGVVMGGGVGISMPARYRVATERTTYAMPETGIGLFPDVGGGWYLSRKPMNVGMWLALTGARLKSADCVAALIATHFVQSADVPALVEALRAQEPAAAIASVAGEAGPPQELNAETVAKIDAIFGRDSVEAIIAALEADGSDWAKAQLKVLATKSPQTLKVAFRQLRESAKLQNFADNMRMEYRIASRAVMLPDFSEGVRAVIVDKDNQPKWTPPTLDGVSDALIDTIFAPLGQGEEWTPLPDLEEQV
jgi:enoyl-CoA hydratase